MANSTSMTGQDSNDHALTTAPSPTGNPEASAPESGLQLVLLAAGRGSRFGGPKQLEPVGPNDEPVFAITARQALDAGFTELVLVTTSELRPRLEAAVSKYVDGLDVSYVEQDLAKPSRERPWGTAHAVSLCAPVLTGPFGVANGDDLYGDPSFHLLAEFLRGAAAADAAIISFPLDRVRSEAGGVSRGICAIDRDGGLISVTETHGLVRGEDQRILDEHGGSYAPDTSISMNLWGLGESLGELLSQRFERFLSVHADDDTTEFQLPTALSALADDGEVTISVVPSTGRWLGLTRRADLPGVRAELADW
jgi:hypothetical protein